LHRERATGRTQSPWATYVAFDAINLTNQSSTQLADSIGQRLYYNHYTGSNYFVGLRYSY
jgi:hypothetical protein